MIPNVPERLQNIFEFRATFDLTEREAQLFNFALIRLDEQLIEENLDLALVPNALVIFTQNGKLKISLEDWLAAGNTHLLFYVIKRMGIHDQNEMVNTSIFSKEFCHYFGNIRDEVKVKYKIFDVLNRVFPDLKIENYLKIIL